MANRNQREPIFATEALSGELCKGLEAVEASPFVREEDSTLNEEWMRIYLIDQAFFC